MKKNFLFLLFLATNLFASIGQINGVEGQVILQRDNSTFIATEDTNLQPNDKIITKDNAKAQIILDNGSIITLSKNSDLTINKNLFLDHGNIKVLTQNPITIKTIRNIIIPSKETLCIINSTHENTQIKTLIGKLKFRLIANDKFYYINTGKELIFKPDILNPVKIVKLQTTIPSFENYSNIADEVANEVNEDSTTQEAEELANTTNTTDEITQDTTVEDDTSSIDTTTEDTTVDTTDTTPAVADNTTDDTTSNDTTTDTTSSTPASSSNGL